MDHIKLLCDIDELNGLFKESVSLATLLEKTVNMVARHSDADVCSIYLYDEQLKKLVLSATHGLNPEAVGKVKLPLSEGLVGLSVRELRPICEKKASRSPFFKYFPGIFEEQFESFLAVPIKRGVTRVGAMVLQRREEKCFTDNDIATLQAVASQLANIIENARFLIDIHQPHLEQQITDKIPDDIRIVHGHSASEGFGFGPAMIIDRDALLSVLFRQEFDQHYGLAEFEEAITKTAEQLQNLQKEVEEKLSDAASLIFAAHLVILKDRQVIGEIKKLIEDGVNAPVALLQVMRGYMENFAASHSPYIREKIQDIQDLTLRIMGNLVSDVVEITRSKGHIIIARELFPSDLLALSSEEVRGIVLVGSGITSHLSILARSLRIPTIIAGNLGLLDLPDNIPVLLDADTGNVFVDPSDTVLGNFERQQKTRLSLDDHKKLIKGQTLTKDGTRVTLLANINLLSDLRLAGELNAEGIGLYRTEFPFIVRTSFPTEQEQYAIYKRLCNAMQGKPVTFRTLDVGGDKILSYYNNVRENNPVLGLRSIRFSLQNKDVFREQVRAILWAGAESDLRLMFPMISSLDEYFEARALVEECKESLAAQGRNYNKSPKIGIMIEVPSVVDLIYDFAEVVDFFSIGTNDFVQFMLGVDRTNENVAAFYLPHHPSVLRSLKKIADASMTTGVELSICGEMGSIPRYIPFLLGIGVRTFSMDSSNMLAVQRAVEKVDITEARGLAAELLLQSRVSEIEKLLGSEEVEPMLA